LDPLTTQDIKNEEGEKITHYFIDSGSHFRMLNLTLNKFTDELKKPLSDFLKNTHKEFVICLQYNLFSSKFRDKLKKKFKGKV